MLKNTNRQYGQSNILDSEWIEECIYFIMMCVCIDILKNIPIYNVCLLKSY